MSKRIQKQITGGWVDESLKPRALKLIAEVTDSEELPRRIGELVGSYRQYLDFLSTAPPPAESIRHAIQVVNSINTTLANVKLMPEDVTLIATMNLYKTIGEHYDAFTDRMTMDLLRYRAVITSAIAEMKARPPSRGDKSSVREHRLLSDVAELIEPIIPGKLASAGKAAEILTAAGIHGLPATPKKQREAVRLYRDR